MNLAADRRSETRHSCKQEALCRRGGSWWLAQVKDISPAGVGLWMEPRFEPGTGLTVELFPSTTQEVSMQVQVVRSQSDRGDGAGWLHGCTIQSRFSAPEMQNLLQRVTHS